jgi:hypothetical protein
MLAQWSGEGTLILSPRKAWVLKPQSLLSHQKGDVHFGLTLELELASRHIPMGTDLW